MFMDHEWRERQRKLAKAEQNQKREQTLSWVHSLRFNEKLVELKLGRVNPITCVRSQSDTDYAVNAVINMPEYVPVDQRIPQALLARKNADVERAVAPLVAEPEPERIDLPIDFDLTANPTRTAHASLGCVRRGQHLIANEKRQSISAAELEKLAR